MLVELFQLLRNLEAQGIEVGLDHEDFGASVKTTMPTLRVVLNEDGDIVQILPVADEEKPGLWTLTDGKKNFFPAMRMQLEPALSIPADWKDKKAVSTQDVSMLLSPAQKPQERKISSDVVKNDTWNRLRIRDWQSNDDAETLAHIHKFATAFDKFCESPETAAKNLLHGIKRALRRPCDDTVLVGFANLVAGKKVIGKQRDGQDDEEKEAGYKTQLCFDLKATDDLAFTLYSPRVKQVVLECLCAENPRPSEVMDLNLSGTCAMTGNPFQPTSALFPKWAANGVIPMEQPIYSKNKDAPCNFRYGKVGIESIELDPRIKRKLSAALKVITNKLPGVNWRALRNGRFEGKGKKRKETSDVLLAYPTMRFEDLKLVDVFAAAQNTQDDGTKQFQDQARPLIRAFSEITQSNSIPNYIVILLIRQVAPGAIQLAYTARLTCIEFGDAIKAWIESGKNLPLNLCLPLISRPKTGKNAATTEPFKNTNPINRWSKPRLLFPEQISRLLSRQWIRGGTETSPVEAPAVGQILDLFLRKSGVWQEVAAHLLDVTLARTSALLTHAGHVLHRDDPTTLVIWVDFSQSQASQSEAWPDYALSQTISLIGSLLHAMNSHVKNYVEEPAYQIGRLLAMMDELHKCYGIVVRDDVPKSLIGNGLLGRAADSPAQALAELCERSRIYIGWARSVDITDLTEKAKKKNIAIHSALKVLRLVAPLSEQLHAADSLATEMSVAQKAHLFLGYLSPVLGKEEEKDKPPPTATTTAATP